MYLEGGRGAGGKLVVKEKLCAVYLRDGIGGKSRERIIIKHILPFIHNHVSH